MLSPSLPLPPSLPHCPVPPVISTPLGLPQFPIFGDPLTLSCRVSNTLVGEWVWYQNGVPLPVHTATSNTLVIDTVDTSHGGLYQCFAYNAAGNDSSVTSINVMSKSLNNLCSNLAIVYMVVYAQLHRDIYMYIRMHF